MKTSDCKNPGPQAGFDKLLVKMVKYEKLRITVFGGAVFLPDSPSPEHTAFLNRLYRVDEKKYSINYI